MNSNRTLRSALLTLLGFIIGLDGIGLFTSRYLNDYAWSEWFINYRGGFVRRGLAGELFYQLAHYLPMKPVLLLLVGSLYLIFFLAVLRLSRYCSTDSLAYFVFCPALAYAYYYDPSYFGRKEIISSTLLVLLILYCLRIRETGTAPPDTVKLISFCLTVFVCALNHEVIVFFLPFFLLVLEETYSHKPARDRLLWHLSAFAGVAALTFVLGFVLKPAVDPTRAIIRSWSAVLPLAERVSPGALSFLSMPTSEAIRISTAILWSYPTNLHFAALFCLSALPILLYTGMHYTALGTYVRSTRTRMVLVTLCILSPLPLFIIGLDYGRWIHLIVLHWFLLATYLQGIGEIPRLEWITSNDRNRPVTFTRFGAAAVVLLAYLSFGIAHSVAPGQSPVISQMSRAGRFVLARLGYSVPDFWK